MVRPCYSTRANHKHGHSFFHAFPPSSRTISGHDMQVLSMTLPPNKHVVTEVGSFFFGSKDLQTDVELTLCTGGEGCQRICGGESCVKVLIRNDGPMEGYVVLCETFIIWWCPFCSLLSFSCVQVASSSTSFLGYSQICGSYTELSSKSRPSRLWKAHGCKSRSHHPGGRLYEPPW